jgi:hypothetical protein
MGSVGWEHWKAVQKESWKLGKDYYALRSYSSIKESGEIRQFRVVLKRAGLLHRPLFVPANEWMSESTL